MFAYTTTTVATSLCRSPRAKLYKLGQMVEILKHGDQFHSSWEAGMVDYLAARPDLPPMSPWIGASGGSSELSGEVRGGAMSAISDTVQQRNSASIEA